MKSERAWLLLLLGLGLVRGLLYLSVVPPWQHYDEPIHFERLFWVVESYFRSPGVTALSLPAEVAASVCELRFWRDRLCGLLPLSYEEPPTLEALGVSSQPLYYYLSAPWQSLFRHMPVEVKLYVGRLVSVGLYILTLIMASFLLRDLFPASPESRLIVPALIALIPAFTDETSALNNDAAAVAVFSLLLWGVVRLMRDGWSFISAVWVMGAAILALFTKRTTVVGVPLVFVAIVLSCRRIKWWGWAVGGLFALALIISAFSWSGAAAWYEVPSPAPESVRAVSDGSLGEHVICVREGRYLVQELAPAQVKLLQGKTVTLGGWVRVEPSALQGMVVFPYMDDGIVHTRNVVATSEWQFYAMTVTVRSQASALQARLMPGEGATACYDGIVLGLGEFPLDEPPQFDGPGGENGVWGGRHFANILSNASGEQGWPRLRPWFSGLLMRLGLLHGDPTLWVQSFLDWNRTRFIYGRVWESLFQSFWARFGWNHVGMRAFYYQVLLLPTLLGMGGAVLFGFRHLVLGHDSCAWRRRALAFLALVALLVWLAAATFYTHPVLSAVPRRPLPVARYAYPAVIPTMLFLYLGWRELMPSRWRRFLPVLSVLGVAWLDVASLAGAILPYYYFR